ncbi:MAG TPA: cytochrome c [Blastocatellia bacterium]|nr:cytochrome c [Blastocatellia bacterium]
MAASLSAVGCRQDMHDQPKYRALRPIDRIGSINDERSARPQVEGTVARGQLRDDVEFYTGKLAGSQSNATPSSGQMASASQTAVAQQATQEGRAAAAPAPSYQGFVTEFPMPITAADLDRGQERFNIYCSVCHGRLGDGTGMIVKRGFRKPPSFHDERLRNAPIGYFFDVETNGFGAMPDYASQIPPEDRWRIISYIRALQLSQRGALADVPQSERDNLSRGAAQEGQKPGEHQQ